MNPINSVLLLEDLPNFATKEMLEELFKQFPGYIETRHIPVRNMAFIEY